MNRIAAPLRTTVLVVDDDAGFRSIVSEVLTAEGCQVACAGPSQADRSAQPARPAGEGPPAPVVTQWMAPRAREGLDRGRSETCRSRYPSEQSRACPCVPRSAADPGARIPA